MQSFSGRGQTRVRRSKGEAEKERRDGSGGGGGRRRGGGGPKQEAHTASGFALEINYSCRRRTNEFTAQGGLDESPGRGPRMSSKNGPLPRGCE